LFSRGRQCWTVMRAGTWSARDFRLHDRLRLRGGDRPLLADNPSFVQNAEQWRTTMD